MYLMDNENVKTEYNADLVQNLSETLNTEKTQIPQECLEKKSTSSVKSKKSSNLLSAFVKRTKSKRNKKASSASNSVQNLEFIRSASSLGIHTEEEEVEINNENYEKLYEDEKSKVVADIEFDKGIQSADSQHSVSGTLKIKRKFFKRLLKKHSSYEQQPKHDLEINEINGNRKSSRISMSEVPVEKMQKNELQQTGVSNNIPTSYVSFGSPTLNPTLERGLQEVQDLACRLQESETYLIRILTAFIKDPSLQKELSETLFQHSKLQWEIERRTASLSNEMTVQQLDIGRAQERALQDTLTSLVKQNRQLQIENEILYRKHEKMLWKLNNLSETNTKQKCLDCSIQIGNVLKHNEELQSKLEAYHQEFENLEGELHMLQKHNTNVEQQLRYCISHIQNLKTLSSRSKMDYELEIVALNKDLQRNVRIINDTMEAESLLQEDFDIIRKQLQSLPLTINWTKFNSRLYDVVSIINVSRSYLNEFAREIITLHNQLAMKEKDIEGLQFTNSKLQENLQKSSTELDALSKKMEEQNIQTSDKPIPDSSHEIEALQNKLDKVKHKHELEKSSLLNKICEYEKCNEEITEKNRLLEQTNVFISNITAENLSLRGQIDGLNNLLTEMGAGDMVKELSHSQSQLQFYKSQYDQLICEKQILLEKQMNLENEKKGILLREETNSQLFQKQIGALENVQKEKQLLNQKYETEHQTVLSLQSERMKYLEEKSMLKNIFNHMKAELCRIQKLEGTVIDISKEASKLALVAEYNQKLGSKLKTELIEKDKTILHLKSSVEKLNDIQLQHTKDKLSLCYELAEICQIRDHLSEVLTVEVKKNYALGDSKKEIVHTATTQIRKYEEIQKTDRSALKSVLKDLKSVVSLKNSLQKENDSLKTDVSLLKLSEAEHLKKIDSLVFTKNERDLLIKDLRASVMMEKDSVKKLEERLSHETDKYNSDLSQLKKLIVQLRQEKEELDKSVKYLQNNTQKLHNDLNDVRKNEKEVRDQLNKCSTEKQILELENINFRKKLDDCNVDKEKLLAEVSHLNSLCEKMLNSLETNMKSSVDKEELFQQEIENCKTLIMNLTEDIGTLKTIIREKELKIIQLDKECSNIKQKEQQNYEIAKSKESLEIEIVELKNNILHFENEIQDTQTEYTELQANYEQSQQALLFFQNQLKILLEQKENDYNIYSMKLEEAMKNNQDIQDKHSMVVNNLNLQISDLSERLNNEKSSYATLSQIHKDMSAKLMKNLKEVVEHKNALQEATAAVKAFETNVEILTSEKTDLQQQVTLLLDGMNESNNRINTLNLERESLQNSFEDLHRRYNEVLKKCLSLENQLLGAEIQNGQSEFENLKEQLVQFKCEVQDNENLIVSLRDEIANLEHQITAHEFQKSELTLKLHEIQRKFETEQSLCQQMKNTHRMVLATVLQMKDEGKIDPSECNNLIYMVQSNTNTSSDEY